ncbi:F-type H+-transporting ATPase subunit delta [Perilla frutescens var. hirtella]|uniref:F-type H+-transporting ATPase subunit delta n=1 Tax=Perilla frutescens var. hirtella TaxID=608512 RepID=A0AAD4PD39_PERFH|nr:F-type H+-transporting ATPase subunit delta [Perilla frutescens var. hirtella]KAH6834730.1 F-type H+-transporting ATPase subunit delta [Perilla frutescens var. hirtella]
MAAALQQTPITFRSSSPPSPQIQTKPTIKLSLSSSLKLPRFTIKPLLRRGGRGASGARMADSAAGSYATALVDVAKSNNTLEKTTEDVEKLVDKVFSDTAVVKFFTDPTVGDEEKRKFLDEISKSLCLQPHVANFVNILLDMKRIDLIKEIVKEYEVIYNKLTETEVATVTSVVQLEPQHLAEIAKRVQKLTKAKNVKLKTVIDESLVAGFTIRYGNSGSKLIDMSVKKQLEEIAAQLDLGDIQLAV